MSAGPRAGYGLRFLFSVVGLLLLTVVVAGAHVLSPSFVAWFGKSDTGIPTVRQTKQASSADTQVRTNAVFPASEYLTPVLAFTSTFVPSPAHAIVASADHAATADIQSARGTPFLLTRTSRLFATSMTKATASGKASGTITPASALPIQLAATAPAITASHPRMILDASTLATLRDRASANTSEWKKLKATCDSFIGGAVNYPSGNTYPNLPDLGQGYQGSSYLPALLAEGLCYQVLKSSDPSAAATYGAKGVDILMKMSAPSSNQGQNPCTDDGYGIRFYGVGFGLGYDWLYDLLTTTQKLQVYTTANAWLTAWEQSGGCASFAYQHPQGNYYAGYFHAKAVIAIATSGDNPSASAEWSDWYTNQFAQRVQPYYEQHLTGGGWPEGFGNYGPLGELNMSFPVREVKTATGVDLVHASAPYSYPVDAADYAMHFTWPSRDYFDDRDMNHASGTTPPPGTTRVSMFVQLLGTLEFWGSSKVSVLNQYLQEVRSATSNFDNADPWLLFLDQDPSAPVASVYSLPLSYLATGMGAVSARSNWGYQASWMSFRAGPYTDNPSAGEQGFDEGSLALVRGDLPLLVNAWGWMVHDPNGSADETRLYQDIYGSFNGTPYSGNRELYNVFYVRNMSGSTVQERYGQCACTTEGDGVRTKVSSYEDGSGYVYLLATHLEDMYRTFSAGPAVSSWSRQVVYVRPNIFVVYDRTTAGSSSYDQYMAWHFPANPAAGTAAAGENRLDVTYNGTYVGAMTTVYPTGAQLTTTGLYPSSSPVKVWQVQERPSSTNASQQWVTVFDLENSAAQVASSSSVNVTAGNVLGVQVVGASGNSVVISSTGSAGTTISGSIGYQVPANPAYHVITDLPPNSGYTITVNVSSGNQDISVAAGGSFNTSAHGVLSFYVNAKGDISTVAPDYSRLPISTLPVNGYPKAYQ